MPSPACEVKEGAGAYASTANGFNATPSATITIHLIDTSADSWSISCVSTDEGSVAATVNASLTINTTLRTATFTAPAAGHTYRFRSVVNGGIDGQGVARSSYSATFCIYTLSAGNRVVAADETIEGGSFGWITALNNVIRGGGAATGGGLVTTVGPTGSGGVYTTDGTADDVQINAAIVAANAAGGGTVRLLAGTYYIASPVTLLSNVTLQGSGPGVTKLVVASAFSSANYYVVGAMGIESSGTLTTAGTPVVLTADTLMGGYTLQYTASAETSSIAIGDYLFLQSEAVWETLNGSGRLVGEYVEVLSVSNAGGSSTISADITSTTATSLTVASAASFPATPFRIKIDAEVMLVTNVVGTTFTVTRGVDQTTPLTHTSGATVLGTFIFISSYARDDYKTTDTAKFYRITFVTDIKVLDLEIYQQDALNTRTSNPPAMVGFVRVARGDIRNCHLHDHDGPAITIYQSLDCGAYNNNIRNITSNPSQQRYGYGVLVGGASERVVVSNNRVGACRHAMDAGPAKNPGALGTTNHGIPRGVIGIGNVVTKCTDAALSTHNEADGWSYVGNSVSNCNGPAVNMRGRGSRILSNAIEWCGQGINIGASAVGDQGGSAAGSHVIGNSIRYMKALTSNSSLGIGITASLTDKVIIRGNAISECDRAGIQIKSGTNYSVIADNTIVDCNLSGANGSVSDVITIDANKSGTAATLAFGGTTVTMTKASAGFTEEHGGRVITISGSGTAANNGTFTTTYISSTQLSWTNASGAVSVADVAYSIEGSTDNIFERNTGKNNPASRFARGSVGQMQSLIRDYGIAGGNERNVYRDNIGQGLGLTGSPISMGNLIRTNGATYQSENNTDLTSGITYEGNEVDRGRIFRAKLATTNATVTSIVTYAMVDETTVTFDVAVKACLKTSATKGGNWKRTVTYKRTGGVVGIVGVLVSGTDNETDAGWDVTIDVSSTTVRIRVTGAAATNINWAATVIAQEVTGV